MVTNYGVSGLPDYYRDVFEEEKDYMSGAVIRRVSRHALPDNVLGCYFPDKHLIYLRNDLPMKEEISTRHHESAHAQGVIDEFRADAYSSSMTGRTQRCLLFRG